MIKKINACVNRDSVGFMDGETALLSRCDQSLTDGVFYQFAARVELKFSHQVFTVTSDGMLTDVEGYANFIVT